MKHLFIIAFIFFCFKVQAQQQVLTSASSDCTGAIELKDTVFIAANSPDGFGKVYEYPFDTYDPNDPDYEGEHNSVWFRFTVPYSCLLALDIIPDTDKDDYDFIIYKFSGNEKDFCDKIKFRKLKPERMIISENDTTIKGKTGLSYDKKKTDIPPGPGDSYGKALPVKKGEVYYMMLDNVKKGKGFKLLLHFVKEQKNEEISFKNIYFDSDNAVILTSSLPALDSTYNILIKKPSIKIEIDGNVNWLNRWQHNADAVGLQKLSEERAKTVLNYFIQKGIPANRLTYKGCSNTKMIFPNAATEAEQQKNRRVEIHVASE